MPSRSPEPPLPLADLHEILRLGSARLQGLLSEEEERLVQVMLALEEEPGLLYARLTGRVPEVFALEGLTAPGVEDLPGALDHLEGLGLVDLEPSWEIRPLALTVPALRVGCRHLDLPHAGCRAELVERLVPHQGWTTARFVRVLHKPLVHRLERLAFLRVHPDRSVMVVERLGHVIWPEYQTTGAGALFAHRQALLSWEEVADRLDELEAEEALAILGAEPEWPEGRLDLRRRLSRRVRELARQAEREGRPAEARDLYQRLLDGGWVRPGAVAGRVALCLEAEGAGEQALSWLTEVRERCDAPSRLALERTGRRLGRKLRRGWAPQRPPHKARERHLRLPAGGGDARRPLYRVGEVEAPVEEAVVQALAGEGRRALHAEGGLWTTLYGLLLASAYFLPVPGMLPTRFLSGPLDVGTPGFAPRRREAVSRLQERIRGGEAPEIIATAWARHQGQALAGVSWERAGLEDLQSLVQGLGPEGLSAVLEVLLDQGWRASRGLPDLVLLPGEGVRLTELLPSRLPEGPVLVEVKGPGDQLRDEQIVWMDRLVRAGVSVELWWVRPLSVA